MSRLRPWARADAPALAAAWSDPEIARWNQVPTDITLEAAESWIEAVARRPPESAVVDLVMVDEQDAVIGELGLRISRHRRVAEIGLWIAGAHRGCGHGRRLLELASETADGRNIRGLIAVCAADNHTALALFRSVGWLEVHSRSGHRAFVDRQI